MQEVTPPLTPVSTPPLSPRLNPDLASKKILFMDILSPFVDLLNRQVVALREAVKVLEAILFSWMSRVYEILCLSMINCIDKFLYGRTSGELKIEVKEAYDRHNEHVIAFSHLDGIFTNPTQFVQDLGFLKDFKKKIVDNKNKLTEDSPGLGISSVFELVHFCLPEENILVVDHSSQNQKRNIVEVLSQTLEGEATLLRNLDQFWKDKLPVILKAFDAYMRGAGEEKKQEVLSVWYDLTHVMMPYPLRSSHEKILKAKEKEIRSFFKIDVKREEKPSLEPSSPSCEVKNIGNTCYMASVLQAVLAVPSLRYQIALDIPMPSASSQAGEYHRKVAIQQALLKFMSTSSSSNNLEENNFLYSNSRDALHDLREAIFNSSLHPEFNRQNLGRQLDAASVLELLADLFFTTCQFQMSSAIRVEKYPNMEICSREPSSSILQIPFAADKQTHQLKDLTDLVFKEGSAKGLTLNPQDQKMHPIHPDQPHEFPKGREKIDQYTIRYSLNQLPPILLTHFKRFTNIEIEDDAGIKTYEKMKIGDPVELTPDGFFPLSTSQSQDALVYKLKSFVQHDGNLDGGHYTSYVEIQGKYYFCDDRIQPQCYQEVQQADFLAASKNAYLCVWEHFPVQA